MKENSPTTSFSFQNHLIRKISFSEPLSDQSNISIDFNPSGEYEIKKGLYRLMLRFYAKYGEKNDKVLIDLLAEGYFKFEDNTPLEKIPDYFYANSIAILYPYIRAFVTTFTSVANTKPLILPTLNLNTFGIPLKENTVTID